MAMEIMAYAAGAMCLAIAVAVWILVAAIRKSLADWQAHAANLNGEAEAALQEWRLLAVEASAAVAVCRNFVEGANSLADGSRAVGAAAGKLAHTAVDIAEAWSERLTGHLAADAARQANMVGRAMDWTAVGWQLWQSWSRRPGKASGASSSASATSGKAPHGEDR